MAGSCIEHSPIVCLASNATLWILPHVPFLPLPSAEARITTWTSPLSELLPLCPPRASANARRAPDLARLRALAQAAHTLSELKNSLEIERWWELCASLTGCGRRGSTRPWCRSRRR